MGALETLGKGKDWDTIAQGKTAVDSGGEIEFYWTIASVASGYAPGVYGSQWIDATSGGKNITYTGVDRVLILSDINGQGVYFNDSTTTTVQGLDVYNPVGIAVLSNTSFTGTAVIKSCRAIGGSSAGFYMISGASSSITAEGCVFVSWAANTPGINALPATRTNIVMVIDNCVAFGTKNGFKNSTASFGAGTTLTCTNMWAWGTTNTDVDNVGSQATLTSCFSPDGTAGSTCTLANAKFLDLFGNMSLHGMPEPTPLSGSSLLAAGASKTIVDLHGSSVTTSDVGAVAVTEASTPGAPDNPLFSNVSGDKYFVSVDSLNAGERMTVVADITGTDKFAMLMPGTDSEKGSKVTFTDDEDEARTNQLIDTNLAFEAANASNIRVKLTNQYEKSGSAVVAASPGSTPTFGGITNLVSRSTGLQAQWSSDITGTHTGYDIHVKPDSDFSGDEATYRALTVQSTGLTSHTFVEDKTAAFLQIKKYFVNVRARNSTAIDTNTVSLSAEAPGGNVGSVTLKQTVLQINPLS